MEKEVKIIPPEGYEIDKENSSLERIVFKKKEDTNPRSWKEYCKSKKDEHKVGYFIAMDSDICSCDWCDNMPDTYRNVLPSEELAEAFLAMMQLMSLRQAWIGDWKPNWNDPSLCKYCIECFKNDIVIDSLFVTCVPLSFPTKEMAEEFMDCFKDLLEVAKPLI